MADVDAFKAFVANISTLIREEQVWPNPRGNGAAHNPIALALQHWLEEAGFAGTLHAEGLRREGIPTIPRLYRGRFAGSWNFPDIALVHPELAVAIEVDRARGYGGASLRTALTKASFNVLTGKFNACHVFLFQENCRVHLDDGAREVLARFRRELHTEVHLFERCDASRGSATLDAASRECEDGLSVVFHDGPSVSGGAR